MARSVTGGIHPGTSAPPLLTVDEIMERYRLRDRRAARRLMDEIGAFRIGSAIYVRVDEVIAFEQRRIAERGASRTTSVDSTAARPRHRTSGSPTAVPAPRARGFWREPPTDERRVA